MLRNTRIRTRLALMATVPAVAALIIAGITFALVPGISVGGSAYQQIVLGKEFQKQTGSPSLFILEIHGDVMQLAVSAAAGTAPATYRKYEESISYLRDQYEQTYQKWSKQTPLSDPEARQALDHSHSYAEQYFGVYDDTLLPQIHAGNTKAVQKTLDIDMTGLLNLHQQEISKAAGLVDDQVTQRENAANSRSRQQLLGIIGITLLLMAASIALGVTVLRSINDRVRRLNEVATVELPQVLVEVQRAAAAGEDIPSMPVSGADGGDELATAAGAFNAVVSTAVEMAAEQSRLRRSTAQMFINLGRRNHKLLSRTLTYITQLESDERDPSTLQNLFRLDHLATRMRRHAESLLVLAGSPPLRTWSRPVPVADVLRAALSEIETYDRVDIKELEPVEVRGASVSDLAHLVAELLENATAFSPPQTRVRVLGRNDTDGYTVVVVDEGIGMSPEELAAANALIANTDQSSFLGDSRMLGLGVVGRLAARHGFKVNLTASPVGGVVAWITLPTTALAPRRGGVEPELTSSPHAAVTAPDVASLLAAPDDDYAETSPPAQPAPANGRTAPLSPTSLPLRPAGPPRPAASPWPDPDDAPAEPPPPAQPSYGAPTYHQPQPVSWAPEGDRDRRDGEPGARPPVGKNNGPIMIPGMTGPSGMTGSIVLPPRAPELPTNGQVTMPLPGTAGISTGPIALPPLPDGSPVSGPIAFRKPPARPGQGGGLTRRVRGAQLPDTGDAPQPGPAAPAARRPDRSAQSVRGALQSFAAGRRTAAEVTIGNAAELKREPRGSAAAAPAEADHGSVPVASATTVRPPAGPGPALPRRIRGAQMPKTDLPTAAPAPERTAAEVRAALSNFVAGRRAAEHDD